jgi:hypothetical protein
MLHKIFFFCFFISLIPKANSQVITCNEIGGIYKNYESYTNESFDDSVCLDNKENKIITKFYNLIIKEGNHKRKYKNSIVGVYKDCKDLYRLFDENSFFGDFFYVKLVDNSGLVIYTKEEASYAKVSGAELNYFYSLDLKSPIKKLNLKNLRADFSNANFNTELLSLNNLSARDNNGNFKINILYVKYYKHL